MPSSDFILSTKYTYCRVYSLIALHTDDYRHCARSASLNSPQSLAHVRGAADELLAKSMYVVVAHGAGLDVLASVI